MPVAPEPNFPANLIVECSDCHLRAGCNKPVPGKGPIPARILLLGQNPGRDEDKWGKPFIGKAGRHLDSLLFQSGVTRDDVYITNVVKCLTSGNKKPNNISTTACSKWLELELELVDPEIIVAMGASAIYAILGNTAGTVEHLHGKPVIVRVGSKDRIVLPCYHPAAALWNWSGPTI